ncbi:3-dehydroquinate synthase [Zhouia sp. PK063]|uniref:3-dehydroquinate synthase n=1 Tax=Zhouia sp. PK063 TaxID=3373602 RepID=UPI0037B07FCC
MLTSITSVNYQVCFNEVAYQNLNNHLKSSNYSKVFLLVDEKTHELCLPHFMSKIEGDYEFEIIEIAEGEVFKTIETCTGVWNALSELGADRKSVMINIGGGVVTDLGGFVAATFMRGINFINVPTTLLAMVDASVGGKTGVDLGTLKNQVGVFSTPQLVMIDVAFLKTLPAEQMRSGLAEMLKHGLIADANYWDQLKNLESLGMDSLGALIHQSVIIKNDVVTQDLKESNLRKKLNFGHTLGHAIESYLLANDSRETLLHGEAIAIGMILAAYLSTQTDVLSFKECEEIKQVMAKYYKKVSFTENDIANIIELMKFDKKNARGNINFVLLKEIGNVSIDVKINNELIFSAFEYYKK